MFWSEVGKSKGYILEDLSHLLLLNIFGVIISNDFFKNKADTCLLWSDWVGKYGRGLVFQ